MRLRTPSMGPAARPLAVRRSAPRQSRAQQRRGGALRPRSHRTPLDCSPMTAPQPSASYGLSLLSAAASAVSASHSMATPTAAASAASPSSGITSAPATSASSAASTAHLSNSPLGGGLVALRDYYRSELAALLNLPLSGSNPKERKALVLDRSLSGPLGLVAEVDLLRANGVDQIHHLRDLELHTPCVHIMYLIRPCLANCRLIASHILNHRSREPNTRRTYSLFFVPRRSMLCERELELLGVLGDISLHDFHLELIPFDEDVLSMEISASFKDTFLDGDPTSLLYVARSLIKLQSIFGLIPIVKGKGSNALKVWHMMQRLRREGGFNMAAPGASSGGASAAATLSADIDSIILMDRSVDLVTPLLTQITYEGLIDEFFGIKNSYIDVDADMIGGAEKPKAPEPVPAAAGKKGPSPALAAAVAATQPTTKKLLLNSVDTLFKETRDLNFRVLGPLLHKKAEYIKETYSERHSAQTVTEMHSFMQKFKNAHAEHSLLQTHINLAEKISAVFKSKVFDRRLEMEKNMLEGTQIDAVEDYIEACICKSEPLPSVLRLCCILSLTQGGIRPKKFDHFRREILHTYGYTQLFTLNNLERLGMMCSAATLRTPSSGGRGWGGLRKGLRLCTPPEKMDPLGNPQDVNYIFNGYAPLSVRLIELANRPGWRRYEDLLSLVPGRSFEYRQDPLGVQTNPQNLLDLKTPQAIAAATAGLLSGADGVGTGAGLDEKEKASKEKDKSSGSGAAAAASASAAPRKKPLTLVVFLGGVSMSEISALRFLSEREDHGRDYVVATTKLINGGGFIESLQEQVANKLNGGPTAPAAPQPNTPFRVPVGAEAAQQKAQQSSGPKMGVLGPTPAGAGAKKK